MYQVVAAPLFVVRGFIQRVRVDVAEEVNTRVKQ
jgi:hypothetical protein